MNITGSIDTQFMKLLWHRFRGYVSGKVAAIDRGSAWHLLALLLLGLMFLHVYAAYPNVPRGEGTSGWEGWWDQSNYIGSARALALGDLDPARHWYPIGYSMLGAPFAFLGFRDPFLIVNLVSFLAFAHFFVRYFRNYLGAPISFAIFAIALIVPFRVPTPHPVEALFFLQFVVPWNTNPVASLYAGIFLLVRALPGKQRMSADFLIGILAGGVLTLRFIEAVPLIVPGVVYLYFRLYRQHLWRNILAAIAGAAVPLVPFFLLTFVIHQGLGSGYIAVSSNIGLSLSDIHERIVAIFIDAGPQFNEPETALFKAHPWLFACIPFAFLWMFLDWRSAVLPVLTAIVSVLTYLSYNDFSPLNMFRFFLIHYMVWVLPVLAAAGVAGLTLVVRNRAWKALGLASVAIFILGTIRPALEPISLTSAALVGEDANGEVTYSLAWDKRREIDAIHLPGASAPDWAALTLTEARIVIDDGEPLQLFRDYRMFPSGSGVRILLNSHRKGSRIEISIGDGVVGKPLAPETVEVSTLHLKLFGRFNTQ